MSFDETYNNSGNGFKRKGTTRVIKNKDKIIKELMLENKTYKKEYWKYREELDKNDWGC